MAHEPSPMDVVFRQYYHVAIGIPVVVLALLPVIQYPITDMYMDTGKELPILTKLVIAGYLPYVLACIATLI